VDAKFDNDDRRLIRDAAYNWSYLSNQRIIYSLVFDYEVPDKLDDITNKIVVISLERKDQLTQTFDEVAANGRFLSGYVKKENAEFIFLCSERMSNEEFGRAAQRELGEEMGLNLIDDYGVMNVYRDSYTNCPSAADMKDFCSHFVCSMDQIRYCSRED
jgi:hypothetical protein